MANTEWEDQKSFRDKWAEEMKKTKNMTLMQKLVYFLDYYKIVLVFVLIFIFAVNIGMSVYKNMNRVVYLQGIFMESGQGDPEGLVLEEDFREYMEYPEKDSVVFEYGIQTDMLTGGQAATTGRVKVQAYIATGELDFMILNQKCLDDYRSSGYCDDLRNVLSDEELKEFADRIESGTVTQIENPGSENETEVAVGDEYPLALRITDSVRLKESGVYANCDDELYLIFTVNSGHPDAAVSFVHYLLES